MEIPLLKGIVIIFALSIGVILIGHKFKVPSVVGYLITGILAGPYGFELIKEVHEVEILAEIGIILLLFTIGIEFSMDKLLTIKKAVTAGGSLQLFLTMGISMGIIMLLGIPLNQALFAGLLITLSSTAIALKILQEKAEMDTPHGRAALGILIFQDIAVVPMMLLVPIIAGVGGSIGSSLLWLGLKGILIVVLVLVAAKLIIPRIMYLVVKTKSRELFLLTIVVTCFAIAWLTSQAGLSLALGAFLAGLIISESEYSYQALGSVLPFKDIFTSFFFVSIGMLFNVGYVVDHFWVIILVTLSIILIKALAASISAIMIGFPLRSAVLVGFILAQVGEFAFILSKTGQQHGLLTDNLYHMFLAVSVITMALTPFIISAAPRLADRALLLPIPTRFKSGTYPIQEQYPQKLKDHLIVVGFGINGRNVSRAATFADVPCLILEMNPDVVIAERQNGEPIFHGDATQEAVLKHVNIKEAKVLVIAISDPVASRRITELARRLSSTVYIIVRTRYVNELEPLFELGANEVIPEEFETSVEIFTRVLNKYLIPRLEIEKFVGEIRSDAYQMFRSMNRKSHHLLHLQMHVPDIDMCSLRVPEQSEVVGKSLEEISLRKKFEITALAIRRNSKTLINPHGGKKIQAEDIIVVVGKREKINELEIFLGNKE